jgi:hypothetical protein
VEQSTLWWLKRVEESGRQYNKSCGAARSFVETYRANPVRLRTREGAIMSIIIVGSLVFVYGLLGIENNSGVVGWVISTVGLSVALRGVCEVTADLVAKKLANASTQSPINFTTDT